jgi:magnesium chelatase subunit I
VARISDVYAAMPSMTGKFELEYEGELKGADFIARELIRSAVANVFQSVAEGFDAAPIVDWFDRGGTLPMDDTMSASDLLARAARVPRLIDAARAVGADERASAPLRASAIELVLEGLAATKRISRSDEHGYQAAEAPAPKRQNRREEPSMDDMPPVPGGRKKYYN